jgi:hypothetical protein
LRAGNGEKVRETPVLNGRDDSASRIMFSARPEPTDIERSVIHAQTLQSP